MRGMIGLVGAAAVALVAVAVAGPDGGSSPTGSSPRSGSVVAASSGLVAFDACDELVDHLRSSAATSPWGIGRDMIAMGDEEATEASGADGAAAAPASADVVGTSDTNVQVAGVDEPDLVETDGRRLFTVVDGTLEVVDVTEDAPRSLARVPLDLPSGGDGELLLHEGRLLVLVRGWTEQRVGAPPVGGALDMIAPMGNAVTTLILFDVTGDRPTQVARADVEGELVAGRGVDGTAHLVLAHRPQPLPMAAMDTVWSAPTEAVAIRRMEDALATTRATDWLPVLQHVDAQGAVSTAPSVACEDVARPVDVPDTSMLQVLTIDTHGPDVLPEATTAVLTDARSVTATASELVVATPVWAPVEQPMMGAPAPGVDLAMPAPEQVTTRLHLFDLGPGGTTHRASGEVPGTLLNQFSMSLHDGTVRVATTAGQSWDGTSESGVTVLRAMGDRLEPIGAVGGLGRGETIHAVRFLGDRAYVVTFRQTDPLYTIDLSDPSAPRVTGELKITGYSAYLHPLGDGRLLGVGQEATLEGQVTGTQVSVFDVADPAAPTRLSQVMLPGAGSEAEWDHHAVLVHDGLVVLPYERWSAPTLDQPEGYEAAAMVLSLDGGTLTLRGTVASTAGNRIDPWLSAVRRALVVDGQLVTVSRSEVAVHDPATLATTGTLAL